jgi:hypothetical protein
MNNYNTMQNMYATNSGKLNNVNVNANNFATVSNNQFSLNNPVNFTPSSNFNLNNPGFSLEPVFTKK